MKHVAGYIRRNSMLYITGVEYGDYTMNHVLGCAHGCNYPCYAYMMKRRFGIVPSYEQWIKPLLVENTLELLDLEIPRLKDRITSVQLCFMTDPFMYEYDEIKEMSLASIRKLNYHGIKCVVLTKGILPAELSCLSKENEYGITLVSLNESYRKKMEPYTADYKSRLDALKELHDIGYKTWVSMEPYPTPNIVEQSITQILDSIVFVDKIVFGRTNYSRIVSAYENSKEYYNECAEIVLQFCKTNNIACHIKKGTLS